MLQERGSYNNWPLLVTEGSEKERHIPNSLVSSLLLKMFLIFLFPLKLGSGDLRALNVLVRQLHDNLFILFS